ncbi:MAG: acetyl-CoA acetyltransferase [Acidimicrobiales bacterium]
MRLAPTTPVIVGVGQVTGRPDPPEGRPLADRPEPIALMVEAVRAAFEDCDGAPPGGAARVGRRLAERAQSIQAANPLSWHYVNPAAAVADALGLEPAELVVTSTGGNNPQAMVNATSRAIGRGELDVAVLVGADCVFTQEAARRHPDRPTLPWTVQPADTDRPLLFGSDRRGTTDAEEERGLDLPIHVFPLFENALRARAGRTLDEHRLHIGALWARFSEVAAANPYAWLRQPRTAEELITASDANRMIAYPYTKLLTANMQVDQGAAVLICSVAAARAAGVPEDRWVFPLSGADADDHWFLSHRLDFHSSPAIRLAGSTTLAAGCADIDDVAHLDLYSCFPSAVEIAACELGLPDDDPSRQLTVTGGLTFGGGPGNNYGTHSVASMVTTLRQDPGSLGLVTGLGWYLTRHSMGLYGTEPRPGRDAVPPPEGTVIESVGGFTWADPQAAVASSPQCAPDADAAGEVTVETYSVSYDRTGSPVRGVVACRTPEGRRAWANVTDADHLHLLVTEEGCGRLGTLDPDGRVDLR